MKNSRHTFLLIIALLVTLVVAVIYIYMLNSVNVSVAESGSAREAVHAAQASKNREQTFMQVYQSTASEWSALPGFFIPSNDVLAFIESVEALGPESGATTTISSIDADNLDGAAVGTLGNIHAHVSSTGSWSSVMRALGIAELLPYKSNINNVSLHANNSPDKLGRRSWQVAFDLTARMIAVASSTATTTLAH